jgi:hypothetical protein
VSGRGERYPAVFARVVAAAALAETRMRETATEGNRCHLLQPRVNQGIVRTKAIETNIDVPMWM